MMQTLNVSVATPLSCLKCDCSAPQLSNLPVCTYFCPSKYPMAHLEHEQVELPAVKGGLKVSTNRAALGTERHRQQGGCWIPLGGIPVPGHSHTTRHFIFWLCLSPLSPHPQTFTSMWCRNMFHFDKLTVVTYRETGFVTAALKWLKTTNQLRKNPGA